MFAEAIARWRGVKVRGLRQRKLFRGGERRKRKGEWRRREAETETEEEEMDDGEARENVSATIAVCLRVHYTG